MIVTIQSSSGNSPITAAAIAQHDTNAMISTFALEMIIRLRSSALCIDLQEYSPRICAENADQQGIEG